MMLTKRTGASEGHSEEGVSLATRHGTSVGDFSSNGSRSQSRPSYTRSLQFWLGIGVFIVCLYLLYNAHMKNAALYKSMHLINVKAESSLARAAVSHESVRQSKQALEGMSVEFQSVVKNNERLKQRIKELEDAMKSFSPLQSHPHIEPIVNASSSPLDVPSTSSTAAAAGSHVCDAKVKQATAFLAQVERRAVYYSSEVEDLGTRLADCHDRMLRAIKHSGDGDDDEGNEQEAEEKRRRVRETSSAPARSQQDVRGGRIVSPPRLRPQQQQGRPPTPSVASPVSSSATTGWFADIAAGGSALIVKPKLSSPLSPALATSASVLSLPLPPTSLDLSQLFPLVPVPVVAAAHGLLASRCAVERATRRAVFETGADVRSTLAPGLESLGVEAGTGSEVVLPDGELALLDVGAGIGALAVPVAVAGCGVFALEPASESRAHLRRAIRLNRPISTPGSLPRRVALLAAAAVPSSTLASASASSSSAPPFASVASPVSTSPADVTGPSFFLRRPVEEGPETASIMEMDDVDVAQTERVRAVSLPAVLRALRKVRRVRLLSLRAPGSELSLLHDIATYFAHDGAHNPYKSLGVDDDDDDVRAATVPTTTAGDVASKRSASQNIQALALSSAASSSGAPSSTATSTPSAFAQASALQAASSSPKNVWIDNLMIRVSVTTLRVHSVTEVVTAVRNAALAFPDAVLFGFAAMGDKPSSYPLVPHFTYIPTLLLEARVREVSTSGGALYLLFTRDPLRTKGRVGFGRALRGAPLPPLASTDDVARPLESLVVAEPPAVDPTSVPSSLLTTLTGLQTCAEIATEAASAVVRGPGTTTTTTTTATSMSAFTASADAIAANPALRRLRELADRDYLFETTTAGTTT